MAPAAPVVERVAPAIPPAQSSELPDGNSPRVDDTAMDQSVKNAEFDDRDEAAELPRQSDTATEGDLSDPPAATRTGNTIP